MPGSLEGTVISVGADGSLITDITVEQLASTPTDDSVTVECDGHETVGIYKLDHSEPTATLLALIGASDNLELTIVGINMHEMLGVPVGAKVHVKW